MQGPAARNRERVILAGGSVVKFVSAQIGCIARVPRNGYLSGGAFSVNESGGREKDERNYEKEAEERYYSDS